MLYDISVIICTYNRADILQDTLKSWLTVQNDGSNVELIVVDNNSTDHTRQEVESFKADCPNRLRYIFENKAGLSFARNRGISEASGEIIAFVDDDVYFDKYWLKTLIKTFNDNPEIDSVGGKSIPKFEVAKPDWITEDLFGLYGSIGFGNQARLIVFPKFPFGLNMAFRKAVFDRVGNFNVKLGRIKNSLLSAEEKEIFYRISKVGLYVMYAPKAVIYHRIPKSRMSKSWLARRFYWQGISNVVFWQLVDPKPKLTLFKSAMRAIINLIKKLIPSSKMAPKDFYLYYKSFPFKQKLAIYQLLGLVKQNLVEIFKI